MSRSQVAGLPGVAGYTNLAHEVYMGGVKEGVKVESPTAQLFEDLPDGGYDIRGTKLVGATDVKRGMGGRFTDGNLPNSITFQPLNWETTPARVYVRRALDAFEELRMSGGQGSFEAIKDRMFDQQWEAMKMVEVRAPIGGSDSIAAKCNARSSSTVFTVKDGYGYAGAAATMHFQVGDIIAWVDVSDSNAIAGAATISAITAAGQITVDSAATWEPSATLAADDYIVFAGTPNIADTHFSTEFENGVSGLLDIIDPAGSNAAAFGITESAEPGWVPYRETSSAFDHIEYTEHLDKAGAHSTFGRPNPSTHVSICGGAVNAELARSLEGFQQQTQLGRTFEGGYQAVRVAGMDIVTDHYQIGDVLYTVCTDDIFNVPLNGKGEYVDEDGSPYSRLADYDGYEWTLRDYRQFVTCNRNRHAALVDIALTNVSAADFAPGPR